MNLKLKTSLFPSALCLIQAWNKIHFSPELDGGWLVGMPE